jgi:hypothetical protein
MCLSNAKGVGVYFTHNKKLKNASNTLLHLTRSSASCQNAKIIEQIKQFSTISGGKNGKIKNGILL